MKLYYSKGACSLGVRVTLHEIGIPCEYVAVDLKAKKTETGADYLKINPKGAVPAIELDNGEVLTENAVIQQYLAEQYKALELLPEVGSLRRYRILEWLNFVGSDLHKSFSVLFNPQVSEETKAIFLNLIKNKLRFVDDQLQNNKFLTGDIYTLPDSYMFVILRWLSNVKIEVKTWPNISRYFEELKQKPSVQQSLQEEGLS